MSSQGLKAHWFLVLNDIPLSGCTPVYPAPTGGRLAGFQVLAIMNKAAISNHVQGFM